MPNTTPASAILDREFLEIRSRILELAASLDRLDRAEGAPLEDPRLSQIQRALVLVQQSESPRAEAVQREFSLAYDPQWPRPR